MPPLLAAAVLLMVSPALAATAAMSAQVGDSSLGLHGEATREGVAARADSPAGWQAAEASSACVPDYDSACDTVADCEPGTFNCWATRHPRDPWCVQQPDGSMHCQVSDEGNATGNETG
ncbi:MAG TPA: hypothetical protein VGR28_01635 [Candidatus Thermoplasmatota archaeon]|nr:hypothetical protein [Candidatus Thermoplasmatota archaeon]